MTTEPLKNVIDNSSRYISNIAVSLAASRQVFPDCITYETDGNVLTWIVRGDESELRIPCYSATDVIDGFYKAEYFLDTQKILDPFSEFHAGLRYVEPEEEPVPRLLVAQHRVRDALRYIRRRRKEEPSQTQAEDTTQDTSYSSESVKGNMENHTIDSETSSRTTTGILETSAESEHINSDAPPTSKCIKVMNNKRALCNETKQLVIESHIVSRMHSTEDGAQLSQRKAESQKNNEESYPSVIDHEPTITIADDTVKSLNEIPMREECTHPSEEIPTSEGMATIEAEKVEDDSSVRRGKRMRKNSVFRDYYLPTANNEWVAEYLL